MIRTLRILAGALLVAGCGAKESIEQTGVQDTADAALAELPAIQVPTNPGEALATVNGKTLVRKDAELEMEIRISGMGNRVQPSQMGALRNQMMGTVVEQFVIRTVLLEEADRLDITVTPDEEKTAYERIESALAREGKTLEDAFKSSRLGEARMREEVTTGLRIDKLLAERLPAVSEPTEEDIDAFIEENKERMSPPAMAHARHILFQADSNADEEVHAAKRAKAEDVHKLLVEGGDFEALAREHSEGPTAPRGGDLNWFPRGQMVPPFEEAAFTQEIGAIGPIVQTRFGYHIIKVEDRSEEGEVPREQVVEILKQEQRRGSLKALVEGLLANAEVTYSDAVSNLLPPSLESTR